MLNEPRNLLSERAAPAITRGALYLRRYRCLHYTARLSHPRLICPRGARFLSKNISASRSSPLAAPIIVYYIKRLMQPRCVLRRASVELIKRSDRMQIRWSPSRVWADERKMPAKDVSYLPYVPPLAVRYLYAAELSVCLTDLRGRSSKGHRLYVRVHETLRGLFFVRKTWRSIFHYFYARSTRRAIYHRPCHWGISGCSLREKSHLTLVSTRHGNVAEIKTTLKSSSRTRGTERTLISLNHNWKCCVDRVCFRLRPVNPASSNNRCHFI